MMSQHLTERHGVCIILKNANVAESADAPDLKSVGPKAREGSSPSIRTSKKPELSGFFVALKSAYTAQNTALNYKIMFMKKGGARKHHLLSNAI